MDCGHMTHVAAGSCEQVIARRAIAGSSSISDCKSESRDRLLSLQATPCGSGPVGRAPASQAGGRGFESRLPLERRCAERTAGNARLQSCVYSRLEARGENTIPDRGSRE